LLEAVLEEPNDFVDPAEVEGVLEAVKTSVAAVPLDYLEFVDLQFQYGFKKLAGTCGNEELEYTLLTGLVNCVFVICKVWTLYKSRE
jgi:hypothetical protein